LIKVSELYIHPLKSAASISVEKSKLDELGLVNDRRWMLVDENNQFLSQRQLPEMCLINARVKDSSLIVSVPDKPEFEITANDKADRVVQVWGDHCQAIDCGDEVAVYLSSFLKTSCRLVRFPDNEIRQIDLDYARPGDKTGFSDGFPLLLISQASLDDLNSRLDKPVSMTRFRPNIVVSGSDAFAEDGWTIIRIGDIKMRVAKPCSRCGIPAIDQLTAHRSIEPVKTLRQYRMRDNKVYFGQNVIADAIGELETGMEVEVLD